MRECAWFVELAWLRVVATAALSGFVPWLRSSPFLFVHPFCVALMKGWIGALRAVGVETRWGQR